MTVQEPSKVTHVMNKGSWLVVLIALLTILFVGILFIYPFYQIKGNPKPVKEAFVYGVDEQIELIFERKSIGGFDGTKVIELLQERTIGGETVRQEIYRYEGEVYLQPSDWGKITVSYVIPDCDEVENDGEATYYIQGILDYHVFNGFRRDITFISEPFKIIQP